MVECPGLTDKPTGLSVVSYRYLTARPRVEYDAEAAAKAIEATDLPHESAAVLRTGGFQPVE
jgi:Arc/MetJ family transcription regulator